MIIVRQSLPRGSKDNHKFLSDSTAQKAKENAPTMSKKTTRKNYRCLVFFGTSEDSTKISNTL